MSSSVPADQAYSQSDASHATAGRDRPAPKTKKCKICRRPFVPRLTTQACCSPSCAITHAKLSSSERKTKNAERIALAEKRERKADLKTVKDWVREAQAVFNAWVRERDHALPCISCGEFVPAGYWDAGHFRSVGAAPELRFEPLNCHKQCKDCNSNTRRGGKYVMPIERAISVRERYRSNLIGRIGLDQVEWLESYHEPLKPSAEWLQSRMRWWRVETRRLREQRQ